MLKDAKSILLLRELSENEWKELNSFNPTQIFSTVHQNLQGIQYIQLDTAEQKKHLETFFEIMLQGGALNENGTKELYKALTIDRICYWFYLRFTFYFSLYPNYVEEKNISWICATYQISNPIIYSNSKHNLTATYITKPKVKTSLINWLITFGIIFIIRFFLGFIHSFKRKKKKHIIFTEPYNQQILLDINNPSTFIKGDYYNEYLTDYALHQKDFMFLSDFYIPKTDERTTIKKTFFTNKYSKKTLFFEYYLVCYILNPFNWINVLGYRKMFKNSLQSLNHSLYHSFTIPFIKSKKNLLTLMYIREEVMAKWLKRNKALSVTCHHEQAYHHFSFIMGARKANVKSIGFQHGIIHPMHPHYIFKDDDIIYHPFPDFMITWGKHWQNMLTENSVYPTSSVVSLGQIRTDIIDKLPRKNKNEKKHTILYASQPHYRDQIRNKITRDIFETIQKTPNTQLIIKPHPGEKDADSYFMHIAKELNFNCWEITRNDLFLLLNACDILITYNSTVASEAIYFKKPVFLYDPEDRDVSGYTKYIGAVFNNTNPETLQSNFKSLIDGTLNISESVQEAFIESFCYKIDGKTCERYINFIRKNTI